MAKKEKDFNVAVDNFKRKVDLALKGKNIGPDIVSAVWEFLREVGVSYEVEPGKKYKWKAENEATT